jgi:ribosomal protein S6
MQYEILYLVGEPHTADLPDIQKKVETSITESGGKLLDEKWEDRRKLAYPIKHIVRGTFIARRFEVSEGLETNPVDDIQAKLQLMNEVLRSIIVRAENLPTLKEFASRKEEERLKHSQGSKSTQDTPQRKDMKPISSQPFKKETLEEEVSKTSSKPNPKKDIKEESSKNPVQEKEKEASEEKAEKKEAPSQTKDTKDIDEKLDEILNM